MRKPISARLRFEVLKRDKFTCQYCGKSAPDSVIHIDHIIPVSRGGKNKIINLVAACVECNLGKSNVELPDDTAVKKQKKQLDVIQEKRNQLKQMARWAKSLDKEKNIRAETIIEKINSYLTIYGKSCSEKFKIEIKTELKKYSDEEFFEAIDTSARQYLHDKNSLSTFIDKILKIAYWKKKEKEDPSFAFRLMICTIAHKRWWNVNRASLLSEILTLQNAGFTENEISSAVYASTGIMQFRDSFNNRGKNG